MTIFDFKIGDKVIRSGKLHKNETLLELFRIAKEKYNQDYLYVVNIRNFLIECSLNPTQSGIMADPEELCLYGIKFDFSNPRQEFECGTKVNIPELNMYNYVYLTTINNTRVLVDKKYEEAFVKGYRFETITVGTNAKITTQKKITLKELISRLDKKDGKILEQVMRDWNLLKSNETFVWEE